MPPPGSIRLSRLLPTETPLLLAGRKALNPSLPSKSNGAPATEELAPA